MVEAAIVFPLVILIVAGLIFASLEMYENVKEDALAHRSEAAERADASSENILRARWMAHHMQNGAANEEAPDE